MTARDRRSRRTRKPSDTFSGGSTSGLVSRRNGDEAVLICPSVLTVASGRAATSTAGAKRQRRADRSSKRSAARRLGGFSLTTQA